MRKNEENEENEEKKEKLGKNLLILNFYSMVDGTFSMADVRNGNLNYTHDGSENSNDRIEIQVEFLNPNDSSEIFLEFQIHEIRIEIESLNDPPKIHLPQGDQFLIPFHSKKFLTQDFLEILDPDSNPSEVFVKILHIDSNKGFFESIQTPGVPIGQFSSEDIINEKIRYVHRESQKSDLVLKGERRKIRKSSNRNSRRRLRN